jgi:NADH-quinone oxidoreductase subunit J
MFILFSAVIVVFSVMTVTSRKILRAAVYLLFVLVATSGLYFMLHYQFLAAVQLTLYAGGIVVLIIFSILLTSHISQKFEPVGWKKSVFSALAAAAGAILSVKSLLSTGQDGFVLPFEVISVLLIAAMVAAIVVAKKGGPGKPESQTLNR